ncbi:hypothetical protein RB195_008632 [Necator americanus]|uniref:Uncharacterized protein n=1 Tax=Necator americanus TaxID=51031 RepID=A0ABR1CS56_NECAM
MAKDCVRELVRYVGQVYKIQQKQVLNNNNNNFYAEFGRVFRVFFSLEIKPINCLTTEVSNFYSTWVYGKQR